MKLPTCPNRHRALTMIEVMVIVAVVFLLAAVAIPTLEMARAKAARIKCVNNLKSVGLVFRLWSNDNDDKYPYFTPTNRSVGTWGSNLAYRNESSTWLHFVVMSNELGSARVLMCPADRERLRNICVDFSSNSTPAAPGLQFMRNGGVSYFIGLEADETKPQVLLLGDRHMETNASNVRGSLLTYSANNLPSWTASHHGYAGNITLSDASVQQVDTALLQTNALNGLRSLGMGTNRLLMPW